MTVYISANTREVQVQSSMILLTRGPDAPVSCSPLVPAVCVLWLLPGPVCLW